MLLVKERVSHTRLFTPACYTRFHSEEKSGFFYFYIETLNLNSSVKEAKFKGTQRNFTT